MKLSCAEAESVSTQAEYKEASLTDRLRLKLHLFFCKTCNDYYQNNRKLSTLLKKAKFHSCSQDEKETFRQQIRDNRSQAPEK